MAKEGPLLQTLMNFIDNEVVRLLKYNKKSRISTREIESAVWSILPVELAQDAVAIGTKAVEEVSGVELPSTDLKLQEYPMNGSAKVYRDAIAQYLSTL